MVARNPVLELSQRDSSAAWRRVWRKEDEEENETMCVDRMALAALHRALPCDALSEELFEETKRFVLKTFCPDSCSDIMSRSKALMLIELGCSLQSNNAEFHRQTFQLLKD